MSVALVYEEIEAGIALKKCQQCGCMEDALDNLTAILPQMEQPTAVDLQPRLTNWHNQMRPVQYSCLGCDYCYPAVAQNNIAQAFPDMTMASLACDFTIAPDNWPPVVGDYVVLDATAPVAVSTLTDVALVEKLATQSPNGLALVGKTETENIGLDKIVKNCISNTALHYLILAGQEAVGHYSGQTLLSLSQNEVDDNHRVIKSTGKRPFLRNVTIDEIETFRQQIEVIDLIGVTDVAVICQRISELAQDQTQDCGCSSCGCHDDVVITAVATEPPPPPTSSAVTTPKLDKAGYFVILPILATGLIHVEHYDYQDILQHSLQSHDIRELYLTIIDNGWVTELSHAAYLGKELTKAQLSLQYEFKYIQDGA